ncbi:MAG: hypothetical protein L0177_02585 [Chloroflexi bacterium]|nr:hypothetical protein [Chloroflexota bacterium]
MQREYANDQREYASNLHRFIDEWLEAEGKSWTALMLQAGVGPQRGTDIKRGAIPRPDTLRRIARAMRKDYEELARAAGYLNPSHGQAGEGVETPPTTLGTRGQRSNELPEPTKEAETEEMPRPEETRPGRPSAGRPRSDRTLERKLSGVPETEMEQLLAFYELGWRGLTEEEREDVRRYMQYVKFRKFEAREGR